MTHPELEITAELIRDLLREQHPLLADPARWGHRRLTFGFTWHGHKYTGTERFVDPCGNTTGCWLNPGVAVA